MAFSNKEQAKRRLGPTEPVPFGRKRPKREESFMISCCAGMEEIAAQELRHRRIGATCIETTPSGVTFRWMLGEGMRVGYAACLWHRTAQRILHRIHKSKLPTTLPPSQSLGDFVVRLHDLEHYLISGHRFSVKSSVWGCTTVKDTKTVNSIMHQAIQKEAQKRGQTVMSMGEGSVNVDVPFYAAVYRNNMILYRDLSGPAMNTRGYKRIHHPAAMTEAAAAGILHMADWHNICRKEGAMLIDPMCGSGTLLCEAALMATNHAPGLLRSDWPFMTWPDFNAAMWSDLVREAQSKQRAWKGRIAGCDIHPIALHLATQARDIIGMESVINLTTTNCRDWRPNFRPDLVVTNPPWGLKQRLQFPPFNLIPALKESWKDLGEFLWSQCKGSKAYFLCNHPFLYRQLGLFVSERWPTWINGTHLGVYGVHLHDTDALKKHEERRQCRTMKAHRSVEERRQEIKEALSRLKLPSPSRRKIDTDTDVQKRVRKPQYSWKYEKYYAAVK